MSTEAQKTLDGIEVGVVTAPPVLREITFTVPAVPVAQPRPRATAIHGRARMFEANAGHKIHTFKASVRMAARAAYGGSPLAGPLSIELLFVFPRPKGLCWKKRPMPRLPKTSKPDVDNLVKSVLDALNETTFADDAQVCDCRCSKFIAAGGEQPHVAVTVRELGV